MYTCVYVLVTKYCDLNPCVEYILFILVVKMGGVQSGRGLKDITSYGHIVRNRITKSLLMLKKQTKIKKDLSFDRML